MVNFHTYFPHYVLEIYCDYIANTYHKCVFIVTESTIGGLRCKIQGSFSSRNNTTSVNSVVYAQKWAWPRKNKAHRIGLRSRKN